ncbi:MAG: hypothetical protein AAFQ94_29065 [Bacteroidota bacterium]
MENREAIENRIEDLKWRALPLFDKLMMRKWQISDKPFYAGERRKSLKALIRQMNLAIVLFALGSIYIVLSSVSYSPSLSWLFLTALIMSLVVRIELSFRLLCLKEAKFLKKIKQKFSSGKSRNQNSLILPGSTENEMSSPS